MSGFKDAKFVKEFAFRTMWNYYGQKERFAETDEEKMKIHGQRIKLLSQISASGYEVDTEYFEVTDLLNSLIGLLIFPEQAAFKEMNDPNKLLKEELSTLYKCTCRNDFINTYHEKPNQSEIGIVIRHIKNSLSHDRIMIEPNSSDEGKIESITFQDAKIISKAHSSHPTDINRLDRDVRKECNKFKIRKDEELFIFSITIPVEDLETVIFEIAKFLISKAQ